MIKTKQDIDENELQIATLLTDAGHKRTYGSISGVAGLVAGATAGVVAAPAVGVVIGLIGAAAAAKMLFTAENMEKIAKSKQLQSVSND